MIREAVDSDIPRIVEMGSRSLREGPYCDQVGDSPKTTAALCQQVLETGKILVAEEDGNVVGVLGFVVFPHYFSAEPTAGELIWYVEPEYRQSFISLSLLRKAQSMARNMGAKRMQFTAPTEEVGKAYESLGYKKVEVTYQKCL